MGILGAEAFLGRCRGPSKHLSVPNGLLVFRTLALYATGETRIVAATLSSSHFYPVHDIQMVSSSGKLCYGITEQSEEDFIISGDSVLESLK